MKVLLVYPNDRMDGLISVGVSVLSAHLKKANHKVELYDTTFYATGKKTGDFYREQMGQVIPIDMSKYGVVREKITLNELQLDFRKKVLEFKPGLIGLSNIKTSNIYPNSLREYEQYYAMHYSLVFDIEIIIKSILRI